MRGPRPHSHTAGWEGRRGAQDTGAAGGRRGPGPSPRELTGTVSRAQGAVQTLAARGANVAGSGARVPGHPSAPCLSPRPVPHGEVLHGAHRLSSLLPMMLTAAAQADFNKTTVSTWALPTFRQTLSLMGEGERLLMAPPFTAPSFRDTRRVFTEPTSTAC